MLITPAIISRLRRPHFSKFPSSVDMVTVVQAFLTEIEGVVAAHALVLLVSVVVDELWRLLVVVGVGRGSK